METFTAVEHYNVVFWALQCVAQMVTNNVVQEHATSIFRSWWKQDVPPKCWYLSMKLNYTTTSQMTMTLILTKPSILCNYFCCILWQVFTKSLQTALFMLHKIWSWQGVPTLPRNTCTGCIHSNVTLLSNIWQSRVFSVHTAFSFPSSRSFSLPISRSFFSSDSRSFFWSITSFSLTAYRITIDSLSLFAASYCFIT